MGRCVEEEGRIANREEKLNDNEDQALAAHAKNRRNKRKNQGLLIVSMLHIS